MAFFFALPTIFSQMTLFPHSKHFNKLSLFQFTLIFLLLRPRWEATIAEDCSSYVWPYLSSSISNRDRRLWKLLVFSGQIAILRRNTYTFLVIPSILLLWAWCQRSFLRIFPSSWWRRSSIFEIKLETGSSNFVSIILNLKNFCWIRCTLTFDFGS